MVYNTSSLSSSLYTGPTMSNAAGAVNNNHFTYLQELGSGELPDISDLPSSSETLLELDDKKSNSLTALLTSLQKDRVDNVIPLETKLNDSWTFWSLRPPQGLRSTLLNFESLLKCIGTVKTLGDFWSIYLTLKRPDELFNGTTDYSFFRHGIRPVWEDPANEHGGKLVIRFKKQGTISCRLWELILLALIGDDLNDVQEHVCGVVFSIRPYENFISIWTPQSDDLVQIHQLR